MSPEEYEGKLCELISPDGRNKSLKIANNSYLNYGILDENCEIVYPVNNSQNGIFLKVIEGEVEVDGIHLREKDEIGIEDIEKLHIKALHKSEIMLFEVQMN